MTGTEWHQKGAKKPEKLGGAGRCHSNTVLTQERKKVKNFLSIEGCKRPARPAPFSIHPRRRQSPKTGRCKSVKVKYILYAREKKSKISLI